MTETVENFKSCYGLAIMYFGRLQHLLTLTNEISPLVHNRIEEQKCVCHTNKYTETKLMTYSHVTQRKRKYISVTSRGVNSEQRSSQE